MRSGKRNKSVSQYEEQGIAQDGEMGIVWEKRKLAQKRAEN